MLFVISYVLKKTYSRNASVYFGREKPLVAHIPCDHRRTRRGGSSLPAL